MPSLAVCIACFNRRVLTLKCLESLFAQRLPNALRLVVHLLDDGSTDGTGAAVAEAFPQVILHQGDGNLYWAGGMRLVHGLALAEGHDYFLWLNDDAELFEDALPRAFATLEDLRRRHGGEHLVVGAMRDPEGTTTYSGFARGPRLAPWRLRRMEPHPDTPLPCDTTNGNFVLIPAAAAHAIGNIPRAYRQSLADLDLGFRARRLGFGLWIAPKHFGITLPNTARQRWWLAPGLGLSERLRSIEQPLGHPFWPNLTYNWRSFGAWGLLGALAPYVSLLRAHVASWGKREDPEHPREPSSPPPPVVPDPSFYGAGRDG